jgi:hypothetical protein
MTLALGLAVAGLLITHGVITWYFIVINKEKVPVSVGPFAGVMVAGMLLSTLALQLGPDAVTGALFALNVAMGGGILLLLTQRKLPDGALIATVGEPMPALSAPDHTGTAFDLASLKGKRVMVKFFRGSW